MAKTSKQPQEQTAAPAELKGRAYFDAHVPAGWVEAAQTAQKSTGCPASLPLAQAVLESGWGKDLSASHNFLGIKWFQGCPYPKHAAKTHEDENGKEVWVESDFVAFPSDAACFDYYAHLVSTAHQYLGAWEVWQRTGDLRKFAQRVSAVYASDREYFEKVWDLIELYDLQSLN